MKKTRMFMSLILSAVIALSVLAIPVYAAENSAVSSASAVNIGAEIFKACADSADSEADEEPADSEEPSNTGESSEEQNQQETKIVEKIVIVDVDKDTWYYEVDGIRFYGTGIGRELTFFEYITIPIALPYGYETNGNTEWYLNGEKIPTFKTTVVNYSVISGSSTASTLYIISSYRRFDIALFCHIFNFLTYRVWF